MAVELRKIWLCAGAGLALLAGLLGWAWQDGGVRALTPQSAPALLPPVGR